MEGNKIISLSTDYKVLIEVLMSNSYYRGERLKSADTNLAMVQASIDNDDILQDVMLAAENDVVAMLQGRLGRVTKIVRNAPKSIFVDGAEVKRDPQNDRDGLFAWGGYFTEEEFPTEKTTLHDSDGTVSAKSITGIGEKGTVIKVAAMSNFASELPLNVAIEDYIAERMLAGWLEVVYPAEAVAVANRAIEKMAVAERIAVEREKPKRASFF